MTSGRPRRWTLQIAETGPDGLNIRTNSADHGARVNGVAAARGAEPARTPGARPVTQASIRAMTSSETSKQTQSQLAGDPFLLQLGHDARNRLEVRVGVQHQEFQPDRGRDN